MHLPRLVQHRRTLLEQILLPPALSQAKHQVFRVMYKVEQGGGDSIADRSPLPIGGLSAGKDETATARY
jgi:hypothetical protein